MKIVINTEFGGISDYAAEHRTDAYFIEQVEKGVVNTGVPENETKWSWTTNFERLKVVEIPDEATDYKVREYDGKEWVDYVIDGKICSIR